MKNHLAPTLAGTAPAIDLAAVLQLLEAQRANGTIRIGAHWLRMRDGRACKASGHLLETVVAMLAYSGAFEFRSVAGTPSGFFDLSITALLLDAARMTDEARAR